MNISRLYFEEKTSRTQKWTGVSTFRKHIDEIANPVFIGRRTEKDCVMDYYEGTIKSGWKLKELITKLLPLRNEDIVVELQNGDLFYIHELIELHTASR